MQFRAFERETFIARDTDTIASIADQTMVGKLKDGNESGRKSGESHLGFRGIFSNPVCYDYCYGYIQSRGAMVNILFSWLAIKAARCPHTGEKPSLETVGEYSREFRELTTLGLGTEQSHGGSNKRT